MNECQADILVCVFAAVLDEVNNDIGPTCLRLSNRHQVLTLIHSDIPNGRISFKVIATKITSNALELKLLEVILQYLPSIGIFLVINVCKHQVVTQERILLDRGQMVIGFNAMNLMISRPGLSYDEATVSLEYELGQLAISMGTVNLIHINIWE